MINRKPWYSQERPVANKAGNKSEIFFEQLFENMSSGVAVYEAVDQGKDFIFKDMNQAGLTFCQLRRSDLVGQSITAVFPEISKMGLLDVFRKVWATGEPEHVPVSNYSDARLQVWVKNYVFKLPSGEVIAVFDDVTIGKQNRDALIDSEKKLRTLLESTASVPWELDLASGEVTYIGPQIEKILGYPADSWKNLKNWTERLQFEDRENPLEVLELNGGNSNDHDITYRAQHQDGSHRWIRDVVTVVRGKAGPKRLVGFMRDITEQKETELEKNRLAAHLRQTQKLEAIGTLAGGIAHDFNNILGIMIGFTNLVLEETALETPYADDLKKVVRAGERAKDLVKQILAFSRQSNITPIPIQPHLIIKEGVQMLRASIPATIAITTDIDEHCGVVEADPTQLQQVLMNLCTNGYQAMEKDGGTLTVSLQQTNTPPPELSTPATASEAGFVELTVSDSGHGIAPEIIHKIFDPFFTTKLKDKGTGMGLSISHGIIQEYGGAITVESRPGQGTAFHVFIPLSTSPTLPESEEGETLPTGDEHILLVDDEELLTEMTAHMLQKLGYRVTFKSSGAEALDAFRNSPASFDLLLTDYTMPGMTGLELSRQVLELRPGMPIILCTGYSQHVDEETARANGIKEFSLKPLTKRAIARLIRRALDD